MKGLHISEESLEDQLAYDEVFVDYFNAFLSLPAFPKVVQYDQFSGVMKEVDGELSGDFLDEVGRDLEAEVKHREKIMKWVKKERLPLFLRTQLYLEFKLCRLVICKLSNRSTAHSSRGLRGYSRATSSTIFSPVATTNRPSSRISNCSWPGLPVRQFGRRPLGSATSLPPMLRLGLSPDHPEQGGFPVAERGSGNIESQHLDNGNHAKELTFGINKDDLKVNGELKDEEEKFDKMRISDSVQKNEGRISRSSLRGEGRRSPCKTVEIREGVKESVRNDALEEQDREADALSGEEEMGVTDKDPAAVMEFGEDGEEDVQTDAEVQSIVDRHHVTLQDLKQQIIGSLRGMHLFRTFLQDTLGIHLYNFWLDAERYKDSLESEPEDTVRKQRTKLFREIQDKYKNYLTVDAKEQIERAVHDAGGLTQDLFTRTQYDVLRRLRSYWIPRFLVHLERNEDFVENNTAVNGQYRPRSNLSFMPTLSFAHSLPPLGDWCRELVRDNAWNRDMLIKDARNKSGRRRTTLARINEKPEPDPFYFALRAEKDAGCPFRSYLERGENKLLLSNLLFWLDVTDFDASGKRSGDRYLRLCEAWDIFNKYIAVGSDMDIGEGALEQQKLERVLQSSNELPWDLFRPTQRNAIERLQPAWVEFRMFDVSMFRKPPKGSSYYSGSQASEREGPGGKSHHKKYWSPQSGRWVRRYPGSSPSERRHRLHTALTIAEDIDTIRGTSRASPSPRRVAAKHASDGKKGKGKARGKKKTSKPDKNVSFKKKAKGKEDTESESESDDDDTSSTHSRAKEKPPKPKVPEFLDVVDNKGTMSAFKHYVQNMEGRHALNQLMMYLEVENYYAILPSKKVQKTQQANHIYKTYFDQSSRRSVSLPPVILEKIEGERPTSPVFLEAQQFVRADVEASFKTFFKQSSETAGRGREGVHTPTTPGMVGKTDTLDSGTSFLQFYKKRLRKTKSNGRSQPSKEDKESFKRVLQSIHGRLSVKMEYFRRYLQQHGEPDGCPKLECDLIFYLEVQKMKELFNFLDDVSLNRKVETIIECFLDSATPPWLQIDIGPELASRIIHKSQVFSSNKKIPREQKDPSLFDEAQSILYKEMLPYWAGFCKQYRPPTDEHNTRLPPTKQEKNLQKRYAEFLKFPVQTSAMMLPALGPSYGHSRSELSFSMTDGAKWKATKEQDRDAASVISSVGSLRSGKNGPVGGPERKQSQVSVLS